MTREEYLQKTKATAQQAKDEVLKPRSGWKSDDYEYSALNAGGYKLLRMVAPKAFKPFYELEAPNHPVVFEQAFCINDEGKKIPIIGARKYPNVLKDMYFKAMKPAGKNAAGKPIFKLEEADPELFAQITKNNSTEPMEKGWKFSELYGCNVIDREEMDWHRQHKQTKLLAKSASQKEDVTNYSDGLPFSWHGAAKNGEAPVDPEEVIQDFSYTKMVEENGMPLYDVIIWKKKYTGVADPKAVWYKTWRATSHLANIAKELTLDWCLDYLDVDCSEFDFELKTYNLQKKYRPTPAVRIKAMFSQTIQRFDDLMGTTLMQKLEEQINKEEKDPMFAETPTFVTFDGEFIHEEGTSQVTEPTKTEEVDVSDVPFDEQKQEPKPVSARRAAASSTITITKESLIAAGFKAENLTDEEISMIASIEGDKLNYKAVDGQKFEPCPVAGCGFLSPIEPVSFGSCPKCGVKYQ